jgi:hypothetical protein
MRGCLSGGREFTPALRPHRPCLRSLQEEHDGEQVR